MSAALSVVSHFGPDTVRELERDLAQAKGQLFGLIGAAQLVAVATTDYRNEVRKALVDGKLTPEYFEQLDAVFQDELESLSAAGEQFLDEQLRAVLP